jgi:hypothetical protein
MTGMECEAWPDAPGIERADTHDVPRLTQRLGEGVEEVAQAATLPRSEDDDEDHALEYQWPFASEVSLPPAVSSNLHEIDSISIWCTFESVSGCSGGCGTASLVCCYGTFRPEHSTFEFVLEKNETLYVIVRSVRPRPPDCCWGGNGVYYECTSIPPRGPNGGLSQFGVGDPMRGLSDKSVTKYEFDDLISALISVDIMLGEISFELV